VLLIGLAVLVVVSALLGLALVMLKTWRAVTVFGRDVAAAGERVTRASDALNSAIEAANTSPRQPAETS
jgi:hypothetical protein